MDLKQEEKMQVEPKVVDKNVLSFWAGMVHKHLYPLIIKKKKPVEKKEKIPNRPILIKRVFELYDLMSIGYFNHSLSEYRIIKICISQYNKSMG